MKKNNSIFAVAVVIMFTILGCGNVEPSHAGGVRNINQEEYSQILQQEKAVVVDVRTPAEVAEGFIKDAKVFADINGKDFETQIDKLDKSKTYIIYCRSGTRSSSASNYMVSKGFTKVYNLNGGISHWTGEVSKP